MKPAAGTLSRVRVAAVAVLVAGLGLGRKSKLRYGLVDGFKSDMSLNYKAW